MKQTSLTCFKNYTTGFKNYTTGFTCYIHKLVLELKSTFTEALESLKFTKRQ